MVQTDSLQTLKMLPLYSFGSTINAAFKKNLPEILDLAPFKGGWQMELAYLKDRFVFRISDAPGSTVQKAKSFSENEKSIIREKLNQVKSNEIKAFHSALGESWYSEDKFTYIGPLPKSKDILPNFDRNKDISKHLCEWLNLICIPKLKEINSIRVQNGLPEPLEFDIAKIFPSLWILESEKEMSQGSAFALHNVGLVTCEHVLAKDTVAFQASKTNIRYPVTIIKKQPTVDLAIFKIDTTDLIELEQETTKEVKQLDQIAVVGYPNYQFGDSGTIDTGVVSGFRNCSGIRRILTSAPIVAGNSGGPVLNSNNNVIGVAVTGTDTMEKAQETEKHGIIPIEAIELL